jgi:hypothetical protein
MILSHDETLRGERIVTIGGNALIRPANPLTSCVSAGKTNIRNVPERAPGMSWQVSKNGPVRHAFPHTLFFSVRWLRRRCVVHLAIANTVPHPHKSLHE